LTKSAVCVNLRARFLSFCHRGGSHASHEPLLRWFSAQSFESKTKIGDDNEISTYFWLFEAICICLLMMLLTAGAFSLVIFARSGSDSNPNSKVIARGGGTTIIQGGTGAPGFTPVLTTIAFHAEKQDGAVTGGFECLARAPEAAATGAAGSAQFTVNVMYVTGQVTGAVVSGDGATLTGTANITGVCRQKRVDEKNGLMSPASAALPSMTGATG